MAAQPDPQSAAVLSRKLAPWLVEPLARLERALAAERLGHAWLLTGPAGTGKINLALVFAARLLDEATGEPEPLPADEGLAAWRARREPADHHPDLHLVFPAADKQTIGVDQIRETAELLTLKGFAGARKVVVIEPAEAMTSAAANALLKTLEEPTPDTYLLLVSNRPGRLPATIRSRCQHLGVTPPERDAAARWLGRDAGAVAPETAAAPFSQPDVSDKETFDEINNLYEIIENISEGRLDPLLVADRWLKCDLDRLLAALAARLQYAIRARYQRRRSTSVTEPGADIMHNVLGGLDVELLFGQLDAAERLRDQAGRGINVELALRVLLSGFKPA